MKKALLFLLGLVLVSPAFASVRTDGMGIMPIQDEDIDLIWVFPQAAADYAVVDYRLDYNGSDDNWGGVIHTDKFLGNYGLYIGRPFQGASYTNLPYIDAVTGSSIFNGVGSWYNRAWAGMSYTPYSFAWWTAAGEGSRMPENKFDFFKTKKMGSGVLGIHINYASEGNRDSRTYTDSEDGLYDDVTMGSKVINLKLGYGMKDVGPFNAFDLAVGYGMGSIKDEETDFTWDGTEYVAEEIESLKGDGIYEMTVALRGVKDLSETTKMVTNLSYLGNKLGLKYTNLYDDDLDGTTGDAQGDNLTSTSASKTTSIQLGHNCVHNVHDGLGKVVLGFNLQYSKMKNQQDVLYNLAGDEATDQIDGAYYSGQTYEMSYMGLWSNLGVEVNALKWLKFRGGISKSLLGKSKSKYVAPYDYTGTDNAPQEEDTTEYSWNENAGVVTTFGLGVVHKNWNVDLLYSSSDIEEALRNPRLGEGVAYGGSLLGLNAAKVEIRYNL